MPATRDAIWRVMTFWPFPYWLTFAMAEGTDLDGTTADGVANCWTVRVVGPRGESLYRMTKGWYCEKASGTIYGTDDSRAP